MATKQAPYGTWKSPISAELLSQVSTVIDYLFVDKDNGQVYHVEKRPSEGGRSAIVNTTHQQDVLEKDWDSRTGVHEYGGVPATAKNGVLYFSSNSDRRVYEAEGKATPKAITPENENWRYADLTVIQQDPTLLLAVLEDHTKPEPANVINKLVAIEAQSQTVTPFAEGADYYAFPTVSPNKKKVAWIQWYFPDMPWEGAELVVADLVISGNSVKPANIKVVSGQKGTVSVDQPRWASDDTLLFLNDSSGYVNPLKYIVSENASTPVFKDPIQEDFAAPAWNLGRSDSAILTSENVLYASTKDGRAVLSLANLSTGSKKDLSTPYTVINFLIAISPKAAVFIGAKADQIGAVIEATLLEDGSVTYKTLKSLSSSNPALSPAIVSKAQPITLSEPPKNEPVHVLYYPPFNPEYVGVQGEVPPAVIQVHGGPTGHANAGLNWAIQYWTSRGWAWVDVNYGGSSGYGREYRDRLKGNWGIVDVDDTILAVEQLAATKLIDPTRIAIRGGSAGGYTVLATLTSPNQPFRAGTSAYGIADLKKLGDFTHKFESGYLWGLIGVDPNDEAAIDKVTAERSPLTRADQITVPLLILQGSKDAVVPPQQAELIVDSIKKRNGRVKYILFEGEGHGWRRAENIKLAWETELAWYEEVFNLSK
ncbi:hypothetical protein M422DRAFT_33621 [Sphaerobolus stellatus SS14]|uniref:Peptidase S9 prolyl oligopeptidase catalytic domain-containing protein n=1 Tax=Sphaerobolus stellatus (strain SS14) TaxID=990650 RepID=A0A0C9USE3_SPHS4|nr:hypothetical protein M422DRAFT_33621 [Sphaerobolus stellatus SS14]